MALANDRGACETGCTASVVVVHPGVQHSRELAQALHSGRLLACFVTSIGGRVCRARWLPGRLRDRLSSRRTDGAPDERVISIPWVEIALWLLRPLLGAHGRARAAHAGHRLFDRLAARRALPRGTRIVVGAENACLNLFRKAKAAGAICVLDAASVHYSAQPLAAGRVDPGLQVEVNARKDAEIRLADRIVVLSRYARETYVAAGVPTERVVVVPPGIWRDARSSDRGGRPIAGAGLRFLYVGNVKYAKGIDLLLAAYSRLDIADKKLLVAGRLEEPDALAEAPPGVEYLGWLNRDAVGGAYAHADVLVLPSRADGFGFVAAEAMASGLPVIVSSAVGAKDYVEHGVSGWIYESGDLGQLAGAMREAHRRRGELAAMGARARSAVDGLSWETYGERTRAFYRDLLAYGAETAAAETAAAPLGHSEGRSG